MLMYLFSTSGTETYEVFETYGMYTSFWKIN